MKGQQFLILCGGKEKKKDSQRRQLFHAVDKIKKEFKISK